MRFKPYPRYKSSNILAIGETPDGWIISRLKYGLTGMGSGGTPDTSSESNWTEEAGIAWVAIGDMSGTEVVSSTAKQLTRKGLEEKRLAVWPAGSLLFSMYASLGHVAELGIPAATNQAILCLVPSKRVNQGFIKRWLQYFRPFLTEQASSNTQDNLNAQKVSNLPLLIPDLETQKKIVEFLDRETRKIDTLISKQEKLIELLKEKRQAVISNAVTKGLDPNVPMKASGIEWLGDVPEHWVLPKIGYIGEVRNGSTPDRNNPKFWEGSLPWLASGKVNDFIIKSADEFITQTAADSTSITEFPGDTVIVGLVGQGRTRGMAALLTFPAYINQNVAGIVGSHKFISKFMLYVLVAGYQSLRDFGRGGQQDALNCEILRAFRIPLPEKAEQQTIVAYIDQITGKIDAIIAKAEQAIALQKEHRTALISAAVTGKIDVRSEAVETLAA